MDISSIYEEEDRISQLPNDVLLDCLSLLDLKNAAQTSILSKRWRYLWTHLTKIDFDPQVLYPEEYLSLQNYRAMEAHKYFACVKQVITAHRGPTIHKLRIESRCNFSNVGEVNKWVKFALAKRVRVLVLHGVDPWLIGFDNNSRNGYPFGFFLLTHPSCYNGITSLQSLSLCSVNVTGEFLEFLLSHCHQLERLFLDSTPLFNFRVKTSKLKYLTILMSFCELEELEIYAENLLHFEYEDGRQEGGPRIVFKNVPMLVGAHFRGAFCNFPFPIFEKLSSISNQLTKLSIRVRETYDLNYKSRILSPDLVIPAGVIPCFPNLKQFIFTVKCRPSSCVLYLKRFLEASPLLEEFKLQVEFDSWIDENRDEAKELQKIDFKDEKDNVETEIDVNLEQSYPKLRVLELVGFLGVSVDVQLGLFVLSYARRSLETIICDTKGVRYTGIYYPFDSSAISEYDVAERRAHKLSKIVAPKVKVLII